jgi:hypothetical protein
MLLYCQIVFGENAITADEALGALASMEDFPAHRLRRSGKGYFALESPGLHVHFATIENHKLHFLDFTGAPSVEVAETWLAPFQSSFLMAYLTDDKYRRWQNARDPLEYRASGRSYEHLPMRSNGLPPPLDQMEIDTSRNPGRYVLREGFIEVVAPLMWLSPTLFKITGATVEDVRTLEWAETTVLSDGVVRFERKLGFADLEGAGAHLNALRQCLFPGQRQALT